MPGYRSILASRMPRRRISPTAHFDLIVSSFFFHELSLAATGKIMKECNRLLAPGRHPGQRGAAAA